MLLPVQYLYVISVHSRTLFSDFIPFLRQKAIHCIVDIRYRQDASTDFSPVSLKQHLKPYGMAYLSFWEEFGQVCEETRKTDGAFDEEKAWQDERFLRGIERLRAGMEKGYVIALTDAESNPMKSFSYLVIGRWLETQGYQVWHVLSDNQVKSQSELEVRERQHHQNTLQRAHAAAMMGRTGEDIATAYLQQQGYGILDRNWNLHKGSELDIVAHRDGILHFVEVKTRSTAEQITPEQAIDAQKMRHIFNAIKQYKKENGLQGIQHQIDSIAVVLRGKDDYDLKMYEDIQYVETRRY